MPASMIEARLVDGKKLDLGAGCNQNKCVLNDCNSLRVPVSALTTYYRLARSLQKLQRAGIVSKVVGHLLIFWPLIIISTLTGIRSATKAQTRTKMFTPSLRYYFFSFAFFMIFCSALVAGGSARCVALEPRCILREATHFPATAHKSSLCRHFHRCCCFHHVPQTRIQEGSYESDCCGITSLLSPFHTQAQSCCQHPSRCICSPCCSCGPNAGIRSR